MSVLFGYEQGQKEVWAWERNGYALYFEPVGSYHCCEAKHVAVYGYDILSNVETACVAHYGCTRGSPG